MIGCLTILGRLNDSHPIRFDGERQRICVFTNTVMEGWVSFGIGRVVVANKLRVGFFKLIDEFFVTPEIVFDSFAIVYER